MQNWPPFYSLIEFHEVPWQKNWELPEFCFSLLLACTWGIIYLWKLERKQASHTIITSHKQILLQFPIIPMHPVFTLKAERYCWGRVKKPQNHKDANTWKRRLAGSGLAARCFRTLCNHLLPFLCSYPWECGLSPCKRGVWDSCPTPDSPRENACPCSQYLHRRWKADGKFCVHCRVSVLLFLSDILDELLEFIV